MDVRPTLFKLWKPSISLSNLKERDDLRWELLNILRMKQMGTQPKFFGKIKRPWPNLHADLVKQFMKAIYARREVLNKKRKEEERKMKTEPLYSIRSKYKESCYKNKLTQTHFPLFPQSPLLYVILASWNVRLILEIYNTWNISSGLTYKMFKNHRKMVNFIHQDNKLTFVALCSKYNRVSCHL